MSIDGSKFGQFSRDQTNYDLYMGFYIWIDFCTTTLLENFHSISAAVYTQGNLPTVRIHGSGKIPPSTSNVWMGESGQFFFLFFHSTKKTGSSMAFFML